MLEENHEGQIFCPYCCVWKPETKYVRCETCKKLLFKYCCICGEEFMVDEIGQRICCFKPECIKIFRYHSGNSTQFWRSNKQKVFPEIRKAWRE